MRVGILGGTGPAGRGIAIRLALADHDVMIGSRRRERALEKAAELGARNIGAGTNEEAAAFGDVTVLSVPWDAAIATAIDIEPTMRGKILVSMVNAMVFVGRTPEPIVPASGSLALGIQERLPELRVVAALHHLPAQSLLDTDARLDFDVLCASDDSASLESVMKLVASIDGLRPIDAGGLRNAVAIEALTPLLVALNARYKTRAGIRIAGIDE